MSTLGVEVLFQKLEDTLTNLANAQHEQVKTVNALMAACNAIKNCKDVINSFERTIASKDNLISALRKTQYENERRISEILGYSKPPLWLLAGATPTEKELRDIREHYEKNISPVDRAKIVLGLQPGTLPTKDQIENNYKALLKIYHPDVGIEKDNAKMSAINAARDLLKNVFA